MKSRKRYEKLPPAGTKKRNKYAHKKNDPNDCPTGPQCIDCGNDCPGYNWGPNVERKKS